MFSSLDEAAAVAGSEALKKVSPAWYGQQLAAVSAIPALGAEEHVVVLLRAVTHLLEVKNLRGAHFDALRESLVEQAVQLWDAVVDRDTPVQSADETEFGGL